MEYNILILANWGWWGNKAHESIKLQCLKLWGKGKNNNNTEATFSSFSTLEGMKQGNISAYACSYGLNCQPNNYKSNPILGKKTVDIFLCTCENEATKTKPVDQDQSTWFGCQNEVIVEGSPLLEIAVGRRNIRFFFRYEQSSLNNIF